MAAAGRAAGRSGRRRRGRAARHGQARRLRRPRAGRPGRHDRGGGPGGPAGARPAARLRDGRHVRRRVRRRDALLLLDLCRRRLGTGGAAGQRPAALVIGSGPVRIGQGIEFDYCAVQAADTLRRAGWSAVMINSNPETVSTDFDASIAALFRAARPGERPERHRRRDRPRRTARSCRPSSRTAARPRSTWRRRWRRAASRCSARPRVDRPGRGADAFLGAPRPARHSLVIGRPAMRSSGSLLSTIGVGRASRSATSSARTS